MARSRFPELESRVEEIADKFETLLQLFGSYHWIYDSKKVD
jgi:hypothetical protein